MKKIITCMILILLVIPIAFAGSKIVREEPPTLVVQLEPIRQVNVTVQKRTLADRQALDDFRGDFYDYFQLLANRANDLTNKENVVMFLTRNKEDIGEDDFSTFVMYDINDPEAGRNTRFVSGSYEIDGQLLSRNTIIIPEDERTFCKGIGQQDYEMSDSERLEEAGQNTISYLAMGATMGPVGLVLGGLFGLAQSGIFGCIGDEEDITLEQVVYANETSPGLTGGVFSSDLYIPAAFLDRGYMNMYVFEFNPPQFHEEIGFISGYANVSLDNPSQIAPT